MNGPEKSYACRIFSRLCINECKVLYVETINLFSHGHQVKEVNLDIRPDHTRDFVNNCVKSISQNCIKEILPSNSIDNNTDAILLNVIYCNGQFDRSQDLDIKPGIDVRKKTKKTRKHSKNKNSNNGH